MYDFPRAHRPAVLYSTMSRSVFKTPITGNTCARSEKYDKQKANRRLRRRVRVAIAVGDDSAVDLGIRDVSNVWAFQKDGKHWHGYGSRWGMRLGLSRRVGPVEKLMRK